MGHVSHKAPVAQAGFALITRTSLLATDQGKKNF
jgi:hypothetical protein